MHVKDAEYGLIVSFFRKTYGGGLKNFYQKFFKIFEIF